MFDPVLKRLADKYGSDWVGFQQQLLGLPVGGKFEVIQPNLLTGTLDADRVFQVDSPGPMLIHTEWESSSSLDRPDRFLLYNTLLTRQTGLPVQTVVILLRKEANSSDLTGTLTRYLPTEQKYLEWSYAVVRLWEIPPDLALSYDGLSPLAPMCAVTPGDLPALTRKMMDRWSRLPPPQAKDLAIATKILMGSRYDKDLIHGLFGRVATMKESVIYQEILQEGVAEGQTLGHLEGARTSLLRLGQKRLGALDPITSSTIESCSDLGRLERMFDRAIDASDWASVLATE